MRTPPKMEKNGILLIVLFLFTVLLATLYFAWMQPLFATPADTETTTASTYEGEGVGLGNGIYLLYPRTVRDDMKTIRVFYAYDENAAAYSSYAFLRDSEDQDADGDTADFLIEGHEMNQYDDEAFAQLVVDVGHTSYQKRLDALVLTGDSANDEPIYARFGLSLATHPAYYELTTLTDTVYRVYIGNAAPDGSYYARLDGRAAVYLLSSSIKETLLSPVENIVSPTLTDEATSSFDYTYIHNFTIFKNGSLSSSMFGGTVPEGDDLSSLSPYAMFTYLKQGERDVYHAASIYKMLAPLAGYTPNDTNVDNALKALPGLTGTKTEKLGLSPSDFASGGILETVAYTVYYEMPYVITYDDNDDPVAGEWIVNVLFVSPRRADGTYAVGALSYVKGYEDAIFYNQIAAVEYDTLSFLEYSFFDWIEPRTFNVSIDDVRSLSFSSSLGNYDFVLSGDDVATLTVEETNSGYTWHYYGRDYPFALQPEGYCDDLAEFQELYLLLLQLQYAGEATEDGLTAEEVATLVASDSNCLMTFTLTLDDGRVITYRYYPYSERHALVQTEGDGIPTLSRFYTSRQGVARIAAACEHLLTGVHVDADKRFD